MKNYYQKKYSVQDTDIDYSYTVPITNLMRVMQETAFVHADNLGMSHQDMIDHSGAFWVITKMKVKLLKPLIQFDKFKVLTWIQPASGVRVERDFNVTRGRELIAEACAEWCCLDWVTRKLRKMSTIQYPVVEHAKARPDIAYTPVRERFTDKDLCYTRVVRSTDIDVNKHTNNLRYNFFAIDAFSVEELENLHIKEYEIQFVNESKEGDEIKIYKKQIENNIIVEGQTDGKTVFRSIFTI